MNARTLTRQLRAGQAKAETDHLPQIQAVYEHGLKRAVRESTRAFRAITATAWQPPPEGAILTPAAIQALARSLNESLGPIWANVLLEVAGTPLARERIAWDVAHPLAQNLLAQAAQRTGSRLGAAVQETLRAQIADAYEQGLGVQDAAARISGALTDATPWQAEMLARTDLNSLSNGASQAAARLAGVQFHTWITAGDDRVRDTHAEAEGQTMPIEQPFNIGGEALLYPGDPAGSDAETINCRCVEVYADSLTASADLPLADEGATMPVMPATKKHGRRVASRTRPAAKPSRASTSLLAAMPAGAQEMPAGVKACSLNGKPGYTGGRLCYTHDGSEAGMQKAMQNAQRDATKKTAHVAAATLQRTIPFAGTAAIEGKVSDDNTIAPRVLLPDSLAWPEMPLSFMAQTVTAEGHDGAEVAGRVDELARKRSSGRTRSIYVAGQLTTPFGVNEIAPMIADSTMRYVSVDLGASEWSLVDRNSFAVVPDEEFDLADATTGKYALGLTSGKIKALTLVPVQAIEGALVALTASAARDGIGIQDLGNGDTRVVLPVEDFALQAGLLAAAGPAAPPGAWFDVAEPPGKMPLTITEEGRVFGHLACWDSCHMAFLPACIPPPKSRSSYAYFHVGELTTAEGDRVAVGKLMVGGRHDQNLGHSREEAMRHYDDTSRVGALLRAIDGKHGIWVCGAVSAHASDALIAEMKLHPPSGDWRPVNGQHELICGLSVPVPGFAVPRAEMVLTASGGELTMGALVASLGPERADSAAVAFLASAGLLSDGEALSLDEEGAALRIRVLAAQAEGIDALAALAEA